MAAVLGGTRIVGYKPQSEMKLGRLKSESRKASSKRRHRTQTQSSFKVFFEFFATTG
jgi:hypothetical protein